MSREDREMVELFPKIIMTPQNLDEFFDVPETNILLHNLFIQQYNRIQNFIESVKYTCKTEDEAYELIYIRIKAEIFFSAIQKIGVLKNIDEAIQVQIEEELQFPQILNEVELFVKEWLENSE